MPAWSAVRDPDRYHWLIGVVYEQLRHRPGQPNLHEEHGIIRVAARGDSPNQQFSLAELAWHCEHAPAEQWPGLIETALDAIVGTSAVRGSAHDEYERAASLLKLHLLPDSPDLPPMVAYDGIPGVVITLVYDLPNAVVTVGPEEASRWGVTPAELYHVALENVLREPGVTAAALDRSPYAIMLEGESYFVASHALAVARYAPPSASGAVLGVPHRRAAIIRPFPGYPADSLADLSQLAAGVREQYEHAEHPISSSLYWWEPRGSIRELAVVESEDGVLRVQRPPRVELGAAIS